MNTSKKILMSKVIKEELVEFKEEINEYIKDQLEYSGRYRYWESINDIKNVIQETNDSYNRELMVEKEMRELKEPITQSKINTFFCIQNSDINANANNNTIINNELMEKYEKKIKFYKEENLAFKNEYNKKLQLLEKEYQSKIKENAIQIEKIQNLITLIKEIDVTEDRG
jgi:hypothetical protein